MDSVAERDVRRDELLPELRLATSDLGNLPTLGVANCDERSLPDLVRDVRMTASTGSFSFDLEDLLPLDLFACAFAFASLFVIAASSVDTSGLALSVSMAISSDRKLKPPLAELAGGVAVGFDMAAMVRPAATHRRTTDSPDERIRVGGHNEQGVDDDSSRLLLCLFFALLMAG